MKSLETDKRIKKTKMAFRKALQQLTAQKDLRNITVKELCELADVNRGTFYAHYHEIHDIIDELETEIEHSLTRIFEETSSGKETNDMICKHLYDGILHIASNADSCDLMISKHPEQDFHVRMARIAGVHLANAYPIQSEAERSIAKHIYSYISSGCMGILNTWAQNGMQESPEEITDIALHLVRKTLF